MQQKTISSFSLVCSKYWLENDKYSSIHALKNSKFTCTEFSEFLLKGHVCDWQQRNKMSSSISSQQTHEILDTCRSPYNQVENPLFIHIQNNDHNFVLYIYTYLTAEIITAWDFYTLIHISCIFSIDFLFAYWITALKVYKISSTLQTYISLISSVLNNCKD